MVQPSKVELPTPDMLSQLEVPVGAEIFAAKIDISDFYHQFSLPDWLVPYFALPQLRASELGLDASSGFDPDELVYPCFRTLPMGFSHAVYLAQCAHLNVAFRTLPASGLISRGNDPQVNRLRFGV